MDRRRELVVVVATTPWDGHRLLDQAMTRALSATFDVLYVQPPRAVWGRDGRRHIPAGVRPVAPGVWTITPRVLPAKERPGMKAVSLALTRATMRRGVAELGGGPVAATLVLSLNPLLGAVGERVKVFYAKDDYVAGARLMRIHPGRLRRALRRQLAAADQVVAVSPALAQAYAAPRTTVIPNGVDLAAFAGTDTGPAAAEVVLPAPVAGLVGHVSDRIDLDLLEAVAAAGHSLLLVGPRPDGAAAARLSALLQRPNVQWVGPQPYERLPEFMARIDVGLVPYTRTAFNRASSPLKTLEYLAAGRPVVGSDLPALRWIGGPDVHRHDTPAEFAAAVAALLARPRTPADVRRRRAQAAGHTWSARAGVLLEVLDRHHDRDPAVGPVPTGPVLSSGDPR